MHGGVGQQLQSREEQAEKAALIDALRQSRGNQSQAARLLGISRVTVWNRMRKYGLDLKKVMISSASRFDF
ncbi:MAG: helix-turn-helix domain-containing protein [Pseudomonadota bacterium]